MPGDFTADAMRRAIVLAQEAAAAGEVPVGAVVLSADGKVIGQARNCVEAWHDPSAHAEMLAMREAIQKRGGRRLADCTLVVTLEPCPMCAAALAHFRIGRVIFGAYDSKGGGVEHGPRLPYRAEALHKPEIIGGVSERECAEMLKIFFQTLRR